MGDLVASPHTYHPSTLHMGDCSVCGNVQLHPLHVALPDHIAPYVDAIGIAKSVVLFLELGGSQIYLPRKSSARTPAAQAIGVEQVQRLAASFGSGYIKVPLARQWVAAVLSAEGKSNNEIARMVRADVATVSRWLGPKPSGHQLSLPI